MRFLLAWVVLAAAAAAGAAAPQEEGRAVRVVLLDGSTVEGTGFLARGDSLEVTTGRGSRKVPFASILEATFDPGTDGDALHASAGSVPGGPPPVAVEFTNRDELRGVLVKGLGEKGFVVRTAALGEVEVPLGRVAAVRFPAGYARAESPPPLAPGKDADCVLFVTGDRIEGTLRSLDPREVRLRSDAGADRVLPVDRLLGVALLPLGETEEKGLRVGLLLDNGSRVSGTSLTSSDDGVLLRGMVDGKDRLLPERTLRGLMVRGGDGVPLSDLRPESVSVRPYWGDGPALLPLEPRFDRAFTLEPGAPPPLRIGGRTFLRGVSMFSGTTMTFDLGNRGFRTFAASVGVDDAGPKGAVLFEVLLDGRSAWKSGVVRRTVPGDDPLPVPPLDISGAKTLSLAVHPGPDEDVQDYADWVMATFQ